MILAIDIGNTNIVMGCLEGEKILFTERISTDHSKTALEYAILFKNVLDIHRVCTEQIEGCIIDSVVPPITTHIADAIEKIVKVQPVIVGPGLKTGLNILMDNPAQVGADLIVGAVAGIHDYPCPLILIDMGTATTICVIDEDKNYIGGMILPGLKVSLDSLTSRTSQLPRISLDPPKRIIGKNTIESMKSGILYGSAAMIDGMVDRIWNELGKKTTVVATGGLSGSIIPLCTHDIILDDGILLKGLRYIYDKNRQ